MGRKERKEMVNKQVNKRLTVNHEELTCKRFIISRLVAKVNGQLKKSMLRVYILSILLIKIIDLTEGYTYIYVRARYTYYYILISSI